MNLVKWTWVSGNLHLQQIGRLNLRKVKMDNSRSNGKFIQGDDVCCGLFRCDYMLDRDLMGHAIRQVEINTVASSFGGISTIIPRLHR